MNFLRSIRADLVEKRLLPIVVVLAALAILVPVGAGLLAGSGSSQPAVGPAPLPTPPPGTPSPATALTTIAGPGTPSAKRYTGRELDPFRQHAGTAVTATTGATPSTTAVKVATATAAKPTTSTTAVKPTTTSPVKPTTPTTPTTTPKTTTPTTPTTTTPAPAPSTPSPKAQLARLGARDSYSVDINVVDATGSRSLTGVERLSPLPSATNPLVEYLGVLKSGRAAAFLLNPGAVVQGPGQCLPRASDCQVVVLKPGQLEAIGVRTAGGGQVIQASIAVAGWRVVRHSSVAAARQARALEVKQGRTLVTQSAQPALTDLVYSVAQGAVSIIPAIVNALPNTLTKLLGG